jgi:hypothetical protein
MYAHVIPPYADVRSPYIWTPVKVQARRYAGMSVLARLLTTLNKKATTLNNLQSLTSYISS